MARMCTDRLHLANNPQSQYIAGYIPAAYHRDHLGRSSRRQDTFAVLADIYSGDYC